MLEVTVSGFVEWRRAARAMLAVRVPPDSVLWRDSLDSQADLFGGAELVPAPAGQKVRVPRRFLELAEAAACHRSGARWALLYRVLFRIANGEPNLLAVEVDDDVRMLLQMARAVGGDVHRMHSFVRFRRVVDDAGEQFVAWYRPDHLIVERASSFFVSRFAAMRWAILTPDASAYWDMRELRFGPGVPRSEAPGEDALEDLWRAYYRSTFNPARVNPKLMRAEMPVRHWATMPEAAIVPELVAEAGIRVAKMSDARPVSGADFIPSAAGLPELRSAIGTCRGCPLHKCATQPVFGQGPADPRIVLVGEQPGDEEDLAGRPFVGPAGRILDRALQEASIDRSLAYVTNAVKHFKFLDRGGRRLHQTPRGPEIAACRPWLEAEIGQLHPDLIVCLGATAAQAVMGRAVRVLSERGRFFPHHWARDAFVTVHPSSVLRSPEPDRDFNLFVEDLRAAAQHHTSQQQLGDDTGPPA